jgi:hypothetical protein
MRSKVGDFAMRLWIAAAATLSILSQPAHALGIAFAYAPEQGSGMCTGFNPTQALDCARAECVASSGALPADCARVTWCYPAGWTVAVGVMHREGIHWSEFSCGWPSREAALAAGAVLCDSQYRDYMQDCSIGGLWNDAGEPVSLEGGM